MTLAVLDRATWSIGHHDLETDIVSGLVLEGRREYQQESCSLEPGGEGLDKKIHFGALFIGSQRIIEDHLEIGRRGGGGEVRVRHEDGSAREEFVRVDESRYLGDTVGEQDRYPHHRNVLDNKFVNSSNVVIWYH